MRPEIHGEEGAILVTFAMSALLLLLVASFAIDVSNFYRHKRQLQTQADAAVLAAAGSLTSQCTAAGPLFASGEKFAGLASSPYNKPVAGAEAGTISHTWKTPDPCDEGALEIEVAEDDVDWFFPLTAVAAFFGSGVDIKASARVELKRILGQKGTMPLAVEEKAKIVGVWAWLVDEDTSPALPVPGTVRLLEATGSGQELTRWTSQGTIPVDVTGARYGVRVAYQRGKTSSCQTATNACTTLCSAAGVTCTDRTSAAGLLHVHGFQQVAPIESQSRPALEDVQITPNAPCTGNGYFNASGCTYTVRAAVDFVKNVEDDADARATVTGRLGTSDFALHPDGTTGYWQGTTGVVNGTGPAGLRLAWTMLHGRISAGTACGTKTSGGGTPTNVPGDSRTPVCTGAWSATAAVGNNLTLETTGAVHRTFVAAESRSGEIDDAMLTENGTIANSFARCDALSSCPHELSVAVDLPTELKFGTKRVLTTKAPGANGGHLDCDPTRQDTAAPNDGTGKFIYQLTKGCNGPTYEVNPGTSCPPTTSYADGQSWICVDGAQGEMTNALQRGMDERIYGSETPSPAQCAANRNAWPNYDAKTDKRVVPLMVVDSGAFAINPSGMFPVRQFAYFYVTGWGANKAACDVADSKQEQTEVGTLVGHFIEHVRPNDGSVYGTAACDTSTIGGCVPVLTQ